MRFVLLSMLVAGAAQAGGLMIDETALDPMVRATLLREIAAQKVSDPEAFRIVQGLPKTAEVLDRKKRGRIAPVSPQLKPLGKRVVLPLIELLAFRVTSDLKLEPSAKQALFVGALEALGATRDPRAEPVLLAIVKSPATGKGVLHIAAEALGKQESDAAANALVALSSGNALQREASIWGFGSCRRVASAVQLSELLPGSKDLVEFKLIARMLGRVGNVWAWETGKVGRVEEQAQVRELAARALITAHLAALHPEAIEATSKALLVVDAPMTPSLLIEAREEATDVGRVRLERLAQRFERSPLR